MSILIKGMEMPTRCAECWLMDGEDSWCTACRGRHLYPEYRYGIKDRPDWCPLVPAQAHGRLIDANALWVEINKICDRRDAGIITDLTCLQQLLSAVRHAPTILPAESITAEEEKNDK